MRVHCFMKYQYRYDEVLGSQLHSGTTLSVILLKVLQTLNGCKLTILSDIITSACLLNRQFASTSI